MALIEPVLKVLNDAQVRYVVADLFVAHPILFGDLCSRSVPVALAGTTVRIASIPDLIATKRLSARPLDLDDIRHLETIERGRKGGGDE